MNEYVGTSQIKSAAAAWERPMSSPDTSLTNRTYEDILEWSALVKKVMTVATANNWSKSEVARPS